MAYDVFAGDILEMTLSGRCNAQRTLTVLHFKLVNVVGGIDGPTAIDTFNGLVNQIGAGTIVGAYQNAMATEFVLDEIVYQWVYTTRRARVVKVPALLGGQVVGTVAPPNVAAVIIKGSETAGPHGHGACHLPGLTLEALEGGYLSVAGQAVYDDFKDVLVSPWNLGGGAQVRPVIFNRTAPDTSIGITNAVLRTTIRTMHRRTVGVGE